MKRTLAALLMVVGILCSVPALAQTWHTANTAILAWDAVPPPTDSNGAPLPGEIKYQTYVKFQVPTATPVIVGSEITATQQTISFGNEGRYYLCVDAVRYPPGETTPLRSDLACSDVAADCAGGVAFGVKYFVKPDKPRNERVQ